MRSSHAKWIEIGVWFPISKQGDGWVEIIVPATIKMGDGTWVTLERQKLEEGEYELSQ